MAFQPEVMYVYEFILLLGANSASFSRETTPTTEPLTKTLPLSQFSPTENTCETFKSLFGLTYKQMRAKNANYSMLKIDHITKEKNMILNLNDTNVLQNLIKSTKNIVILIHGFMESSNGAMVQALAREYLHRADMELLAVDGHNAIDIEYFISTTHVRLLGEELGWFLCDIINKGADASKVTIVGHSLGAHIAGVAGKVVHQQTGALLGRITGLDPAKPCFNQIHPDGRLDSTDAMLVDVIHTNAGFLGLVEPIGHVNFYPNGGMSQPGCVLVTCHHSRAWELYSETIIYADHFPGRKCENWTTFQSGGCVKNDVAYMGAVTGIINPGNYYLTTAESSPFGLGASGCG